MTFQCTKCGNCCQNIRYNQIYTAYDNGYGVCIHYNQRLRLCNIYETRPMICRVDEFYELYYKDKIQKELYYQVNYNACHELKRRND